MSLATPDEHIEPVIGLEVHCQLRTEAKLFSPAPARAEPSEGPNARTAPLDLGHPGTLPVLNEKAVELALRLGLATGCRVAERSAFARKHYVYSDLAKGYQITQRADPLCYDGRVDVPADAAHAAGASPRGDGSRGDGQPETRQVRLRRLHLEEDAAKLIHEDAATKADFNRAGTPLVEIVTEPDLRSPREAALFLKNVRRQARYLRVSDGRMETGSLRCDANVSLRRRGGAVLGGRVEVKNLNSFRHLERALRHEAARQERLLERGEPVEPATRRWDEDAGATRPLRGKETAPDYRYLPEPNLPPLVVKEALLNKVRASMPERPDERAERLIEEIGLPERAAEMLTQDRALADFYEETVSRLYKLTGGGNTRRQAQRTAHFLLNEGRRVLAEQRAPIDALPARPQQVAELVYLLIEDELPGASAAAEVFGVLLEGERDDPRQIAREEGLVQAGGGREALAPLVERTLERHSKNVHRYKSGKTELMNSFVGEVRSAFEEENDGTPDPKLIRKMIEERLN
jgi:aspartyl-tRNA(Asn)/glutamyl-tRNA(Gln) amidotransferase subunit B